MRSTILFLLIFLISIFCRGQQFEGIKFEKGLNWNQIKEKAKKEHKYIFLDAYTTWCIPCKQMSENVFGLKKVGDFFNQNFINVAVQFDETRKDIKEVKRWRTDAKSIKSLYHIDSYPTYLFFSPDGLLAHVIKGAIFEPDEFIAKANESLDPAKQLSELRKKYEIGNRSEDFLLRLINAAEKAGDYLNLPSYVNDYLMKQNGLVTIHNLQIAALGVNNANDLAYKMILNNPDMANSSLGKHQRTKILNQIIFDDDIFPLLRTNGKIKKSRMMISYSGEINSSVNWQAIKDSLSIKYGDLSGFIYTNAQLIYFMWLKDWTNFNLTMGKYIANDGDLNLNYVANMVSYLIAAGNKESAMEALDWAKVLLTNESVPYYKKDYSRLLYKAGKKEQAIALMQDYINTKGVNDKSAVENIEKMKRGEEFYW
jgi:thioredoxin-related protein